MFLTNDFLDTRPALGQNCAGYCRRAASRTFSGMNPAEIIFNAVRFAYHPDGWSLCVPKLRMGQERVTCIIGPNGSGKSTLLRLAAGILTPHEGSVRLGSEDIGAIPRRMLARRIGFLPQEAPPLFDVSVIHSHAWDVIRIPVDWDND